MADKSPVLFHIGEFHRLDKERQDQGNIEAEKAEWKKEVEGRHQLPNVSSERMDAKIKT